MALKIMEWNIKGGAALPWANGYRIRPEIVEKIMEQNADIIVLSEFCVSSGWDYFQEQLMGKYVWFMNYSTGKNGVLICINSKLANPKPLVNKFYKEDTVFAHSEDCNMLQVSIPLSVGKTITIMGCRVEVGISQRNVSKKDYDERGKAFNRLLIPAVKRRLSSSDIYVVCGDFNNAYCRGNLRENFDPEEYRGYAHCNYNLNIIKDAFDSMGFTMADTDKNGNPIATFDGYIPDDHIFVRGLEVRSCKPVHVGDLSDHDIILAETDIII